jgi:hypothetical protein
MKPLSFPPSPPSSFDSLLFACDQYQSTQFSRIEHLSVTDLDSLTADRFAALRQRANDEKSVLASCFVINCLIKLCPEWVFRLIVLDLIVQKMGRLSLDAYKLQLYSILESHTTKGTFSGHI